MLTARETLQSRDPRADRPAPGRPQMTTTVLALRSGAHWPSLDPRPPARGHHQGLQAALRPVAYLSTHTPEPERDKHRLRGLCSLDRDSPQLCSRHAGTQAQEGLTAPLPPSRSPRQPAAERTQRPLLRRSAQSGEPPPAEAPGVHTSSPSLSPGGHLHHGLQPSTP